MISQQEAVLWLHPQTTISHKHFLIKEQQSSSTVVCNIVSLKCAFRERATEIASCSLLKEHSKCLNKLMTSPWFTPEPDLEER